MISLANLLMRIWNKFSRRRRRQFFLVMVLMLVSAFAEVIALGAVLPFLGILTAPEKVFNNPIILDIASKIGITSADQLMLPLTVTFALLALIAGAIRILLLWVSTRIAYASGADISIEVYRRTLYQPYQVHLARSSSEVISAITSKAGGAANVLQLLLTLVSSIVLMFAIIFALFAVDPMIALVSSVGFGVSYGIITWLSRQRLRRNSQRIAYEQTQVIKAMQVCQQNSGL